MEKNWRGAIPIVFDLQPIALSVELLKIKLLNFKFSRYLQDNEIIELCGVARTFVQKSENGPRSKMFDHP